MLELEAGRIALPFFSEMVEAAKKGVLDLAQRVREQVSAQLQENAHRFFYK